MSHRAVPPASRALITRGHELGWYTGEKHRRIVESTGARFHAYRHARAVDESELDVVYPARARLRGIEQLKFDMKHVFIDAAPRQLTDLEQIVRESFRIPSSCPRPLSCSQTAATAARSSRSLTAYR